MHGWKQIRSAPTTKVINRMQRNTRPGSLRYMLLLAGFWYSLAVAAHANTPRPDDQGTTRLPAPQRSSKHLNRGLDCAICHGTDDPGKRPAMAKCLECHDSYQAVAERSRDKVPNPHASHLGQPRCTECHSEHGGSVLLCSRCHLFEFKVP